MSLSPESPGPESPNPESPDPVSPAPVNLDKPAKKAVIYVNLGTPEAPTPSAVRAFLREFLWDRRVVEVPRAIWWLILNLIILPFRPGKVARGYKAMWLGGQSPLRLFSEALVAKVDERLQAEQGSCAYLAMTYGQPSISEVVDRALAEGAERLHFVPLYPQYSATTTAAVCDVISRKMASLRDIPQWSWCKDYHQHPGYIEALAQQVERHWQERGRAEHLLLSYHGIPQRNVDLGDPYQTQCEATSAALAKRLGLNEADYTISYQSRLGRAAWLQPYTEPTVKAMAEQGLKRLDVICPAFAVDCLETLEEIDQEVAAVFYEAGGEDFRYITCLNDSDAHCDLMLALADS